MNEIDNEDSCEKEKKYRYHCIVCGKGNLCSLQCYKSHIGEGQTCDITQMEVVRKMEEANEKLIEKLQGGEEDISNEYLGVTFADELRLSGVMLSEKATLLLLSSMLEKDVNDAIVEFLVELLDANISFLFSGDHIRLLEGVLEFLMSISSLPLLERFVRTMDIHNLSLKNAKLYNGILLKFY